MAEEAHVRTEEADREAALRWIANWGGCDFSETEEMDALIQAFSAHRITGSAWTPEGWKLVPLDATPAMVEAGETVAYEGNSFSGHDAAAIWRAMLESVPNPPAMDRGIIAQELFGHLSHDNAIAEADRVMAWLLGRGLASRAEAQPLPPPYSESTYLVGG